MHSAGVRTSIGILLCVMATAVAAVLAADDDKKLKPGDKVTFQRGAKQETGEFVEYTNLGWLKVRVTTKQGNTHTTVVPPDKVEGLGSGERPIRKPKSERPASEKPATDKPPRTPPPDGQPPAIGPRPNPGMGAGARPGFGPGMRPGFGPPGARPGLGPGGGPGLAPSSNPPLGSDVNEGNPISFHGDKQPKKGDEITGDRLALQGDWEPLVAQVDGKVAPNSDLYKFQISFSRTECTWLGGQPYRYTLDASSSPKMISLWLKDVTGSSGCRGIYEIGEGSLKICLNSDYKDKWPLQFNQEPGARCIFLICKRPSPAKQVVAAPPSTEPPAATHPAKPEDRKTIIAFADEAIKLLEAEKYADFVVHAIPPELVKATPADQREEQMGLFTQMRPNFIVTFLAMKEIEPQMSADDSVASFDVSKVAGGVPAKIVKLQRIDGQWYLGH